MLKEIICDKLPNRQIVFHEGLNVIEGDENAANSIGKSSALLLIDFAFGGQTYSQRDDILAHVGAHDVMMHFVFDGVNYYFKRSTSNPSTIFQCDSSYNKIERTYIIDEYRKLLLSLYHLPGTYLSFRDIVGQFSRIYQRNNCDEKDPLHPVDKVPGTVDLAELEIREIPAGGVADQLPGIVPFARQHEQQQAAD